MEIYISLGVALIGLVIFFGCKKPEYASAKECGRIAFAFGLLAFLLQLGSASLAFLKGH